MKSTKILGFTLLLLPLSLFSKGILKSIDDCSNCETVAHLLNSVLKFLTATTFLLGILMFIVGVTWLFSALSLRKKQAFHFVISLTLILLSPILVFLPTITRLLY